MRRLAVLAGALLLAGCGGEEDPAASGPGRAELKLIENLYDGRFERAWGDLHPVHQLIVSRERFARCAQERIPVGKLDSIEVLDVFDDNVTIQGLPTADLKAVRVRVTSFEGESFTDVDHFAEVRGRWRWVLSEPSVRAYRQNRCP